MVDVQVVGDYDLGEVRRKIVDFCSSLPFTDKELEQVAIVVTELATNLVRYTNDGGVISCHAKTGHPFGVVIRSADNGPGIKNCWEAMVDGKSSIYSMGGGLGAVQRLSTEFSIETGPQGTIIEITKIPESCNSSNIVVGLYARPHPELSVSGDGFYVSCNNSRTLIVLFDVLGHGVIAHQEAVEIQNMVKKFHNLPLSQMVSLVHNQLIGRRGAVLSVARINEDSGLCQFVGIGNVAAKVVRQHRVERMVNQNGVLGIRLPEVKVKQVDWTPGSILVMTTDGVSENWELDDIKGMMRGDPGIVCWHIVEKWGHQTDDASVLIAWDKR